MAETKKAQGAHTEVPGGHGGGFPPFKPDTFASQLVWLAITFVALYVLMSKLALPRVAAIIAARSGRISDDLAAAKRLKDESDVAVAAYEAALAEARTRAQAIGGETHDKLAAETEASRKALEAELNAKLAGAEKAIAATKASAMANVRGIAIDAAGAIVARLIGTTPTAAAVEAAVDDALKQ